MEKIASKKEYPNLFSLSSKTAEQHYKEHSVDETIKLSNLLNKEVSKGIKAFISENNQWDLFIIEGVAIQPKLISEFRFKDCDFLPIFIIDNDKDRIKEIIYTRGLWNGNNNYANWVKEIEIDFLIRTNFNYLNESKNLNLPYFIIEKNRNKTIKKVSNYILSNLNI